MPFSILTAALMSHSEFHIFQEGQVFSFGGVIGEDAKTRTNNLHSMWLGVPKLRQIAWQSVLHYLPHLADLPAEKLVYGGVPLDLVKSVVDAA